MNVTEKFASINIHGDQNIETDPVVGGFFFVLVIIPLAILAHVLQSSFSLANICKLFS
jgi:hypothetical protein